MIIPAIDIQGGEAVRLLKGDYSQKTVYNKDPAAQARVFEEMGAEYIHIVDLDGAKYGSAINFNVIKKIRESVSVPLQLGGGIRGIETVSLYLDALKINRVILGTAAINDPEFLVSAIKKYGPAKIVGGVDVRRNEEGSFVAAANGWTSDACGDYLTLIKRLTGEGVKYFVLTDISRDGTLTSPNWELYKNTAAAFPDIGIIVSGGVSREEDIENAAKYYGVIIGKAYYEERVDLRKWLKKE